MRQTRYFFRTGLNTTGQLKINVAVRNPWAIAALSTSSMRGRTRLAVSGASAFGRGHDRSDVGNLDLVEAEPAK